MESDYKLQQSQDNNSVMQNQMCIQALRAVLSVAQSHSKKSSRTFISNTVASKSGLLTKPIVKGAFRDPGEIIIVVIPLAKQISIMLCAIFWGKSLFKFMSNKDTKLYAFFYILK
jgi:hypothetical protein